MKLTPLELPGAFAIDLAPRGDARGYFMRTYDEATFAAQGLPTRWVQENQSRTGTRHTVRGLHLQRPPHAETKIVRCVRGAIFDVLVDLRRSSPAYGKWVGLELSEDNQRVAVVPKGFAHGFCTLTDDTIVCYKVDEAYAPDHEVGLPWDDPTLAIAWPTKTPVLSDRDRGHAPFATFESPFA